MEILKLITTLISYLTSREANLNTRTLIDLYDEEDRLLKKIIQAHSDDNLSPSGDYIILLTNRLEQTRKLREVFEAKAIPS